jgi:hypothetical protein
MILDSISYGFMHLDVRHPDGDPATLRKQRLREILFGEPMPMLVNIHATNTGENGL